MTRFAPIAGMCTLVLASGCVADVDMSKVEPEKIYRTGSNIAQREHSPGAANVETKTVNTADPGLGIPGGIPTNGPHPVGH